VVEGEAVGADAVVEAVGDAVAVGAGVKKSQLRGCTYVFK
jgi:hypothetical protein